MRYLEVIAIGFAAFLALAQPVLAQNTVGRSVVDGRAVILLGDGTWQFEALPENESCTILSGPFEFCPLPLWRRATASANPDLDAEYRIDSRSNIIFIIEEIGRRDGLSIEGMRAGVLGTVAAASNTTTEDVRVLDTYRSTVDSQEFETLVYVAVVNGLELTVANTIVLLDSSVMQATTYFVGSEFTDIQRQRVAQVLDRIHIHQ